MRYYELNLLLIDDFEDQELENSALSTSEISKFISHDLPFGLKVVRNSVKMLNEDEFKQLQLELKEE